MNDMARERDQRLEGRKQSAGFRGGEVVYDFTLCGPEMLWE